MLDYLHDVERRLPALLLEPINSWNGMYVSYEHPHVRRLWKQDGENRIYLHHIEACEPGQELWHKHPWPSAMRILSGQYLMELGLDTGLNEQVAATLQLSAGDEYEMVNPDAMHSVRPVDGRVLSLMVTGPRYYPNDQPPRVKNDELTHYNRVALHSDFYRHYVPQ